MNNNLNVIFNGVEFEFTSSDSFYKKNIAYLEKQYNKFHIQNIADQLENITNDFYWYNFDYEILLNQSLKFFSKKQIQKKVLKSLSKHKLVRQGIREAKISGYVYLAKSNIDFKIGCSTNPKKRVKTISFEQKRDYELVDLIKSDDIYYLETINHLINFPYRLQGEYFENNKNVKLYAV